MSSFWAPKGSFLGFLCRTFCQYLDMAMALLNVYRLFLYNEISIFGEFLYFLFSRGDNSCSFYNRTPRITSLEGSVKVFILTKACVHRTKQNGIISEKHVYQGVKILNLPLVRLTP